MNKTDLAIFQNDQGAIELPVDVDANTIWASQKQMADLFQTTSQNITTHLKSIFSDGELDEAATCKEYLQVQSEGSREVKRKIKIYNLDAIIAVGYKVGTKKGTEFRRWSNKILKSYLADGFVINPKRIKHNQSRFQKAITDMKALSESSINVGVGEVTDLSIQFAKTWFSLDAYDKSSLPVRGNTKTKVKLGAQDLYKVLDDLKEQLIAKGEATELFAQEKNKNSLEGLFGNVFQSFGGEDVYPSVEDKAAHLLYFIVKNHVFNDGNKRSGAYAFIWFLKEANLLNTTEISPQALTAITLLVAESDPSEKDKMIGLVLILLGANNSCES